MSLLKLTPTHKEIAVMSLKCKSVSEIAKKFNIHKWSVYRILEDALVREYCQKLSERLFELHIDRIFEEDIILFKP